MSLVFIFSKSWISSLPKSQQFLPIGCHFYIIMFMKFFKHRKRHLEVHLLQWKPCQLWWDLSIKDLRQTCLFHCFSFLSFFFFRILKERIIIKHENIDFFCCQLRHFRDLPVIPVSFYNFLLQTQVEFGFVIAFLSWLSVCESL